jgi:hypothetical protein
MREESEESRRSKLREGRETRNWYRLRIRPEMKAFRMRAQPMVQVISNVFQRLRTVLVMKVHDSKRGKKRRE